MARSLAALLIAGVATKEGLETWRGEDCCAAPHPGAPIERHNNCGG